MCVNCPVLKVLLIEVFSREIIDIDIEYIFKNLIYIVCIIGDIPGRLGWVVGYLLLYVQLETTCTTCPGIASTVLGAFSCYNVICSILNEAIVVLLKWNILKMFVIFHCQNFKSKYVYDVH